MTYQTRLYLHGALAAVLNGISNSAVVVLVDPTTFNLFQGGALKLGTVLAASGLLAFFTYLKEHPLPKPQDTDFHEAKAEMVEKAKSSGTGSGA